MLYLTKKSCRTVDLCSASSSHISDDTITGFFSSTLLSMPTSADRRQALFDRGRAAFEHMARGVLEAQPQLRGLYPCPQCLMGFPVTALEADQPALSVDHVPARAYSRGPVLEVLTCTACNSHAGARLEGELKKRRIAEDFAAGLLSEPTYAHLEAGGVRVPVRATRVGGQLTMIGAKKATNPVDFAAHQDWWDAQTESGTIEFEFKVHMKGYHHGRAQLALIRVAYLAAFAAFGYSYIWRPQLDRVRQQVQDPGGSELGDVVPVVKVPAELPETHRIMLAYKPVHGLWVQIGRDLVVLPAIDSSPDFWEQIAAEASTGQEVTMTAVAAREWPRRPEYLLDLQADT